MWMASSTSPPGGAGPSATSCGSMPRAVASEGKSSSATKINSGRSIHGPLECRSGLVEVRPQPAFGELERDPAPRRIFLELVAADPGDAEILAVAVAEIEAGHGRGRKHREILGQLHLAG